MKIVLDEKRCEGYGFCEERAGHLMHLDDDGFLTIVKPEIDAGEIDAARSAVRSCPVAALSLGD